MASEKKKLGSKIKSLVSDYQNSDEEEQDGMSTDEGDKSEYEEQSDDSSSKSRENKEYNNENNVQLVNMSATTDELNEHGEANGLNNEEVVREPFQAYKLIPENGFLPGSENIKLPPVPNELCSKELQDKIIQVRRRMDETNYNINEEIQNKKAFKNPSIYEKFIEHYDLDEFGSSFPTYIKDLKSEGYLFYDELDNIQKREWKEKEKKSSKVEVIVGTRKPKT